MYDKAHFVDDIHCILTIDIHTLYHPDYIDVHCVKLLEFMLDSVGVNILVTYLI